MPILGMCHKDMSEYIKMTEKMACMHILKVSTSGIFGKRFDQH